MDAETESAYPLYITKLGINIRDYFAAAALTGLLLTHMYSGNYEWFAREAYAHADAMLKEKQRGKKE